MADQCSVLYSSLVTTTVITDPGTTSTRTTVQDPVTQESLVPIPTTTCACLLGPILCPTDQCQTLTSFRTDLTVVPGSTGIDVITQPGATHVETVTQLTPVSMQCPTGVNNPPNLPTAVVTSLPPSGAAMFSSFPASRSVSSTRTSATRFSTQVTVITVSGAPMTSSAVVPVVQPDDQGSSNNAGSIGAIAGGTVGGLVLLFIIGTVVMIMYRGRQRRREEQDALAIAKEGDLWQPEKRQTFRVDAFAPDIGLKGDDRSDEGGALSGSQSGHSDRPHLPNIAVPEDDDDDDHSPHSAGPHVQVPMGVSARPVSVHNPGMSIPSPYGHVPAPYNGQHFPYPPAGMYGYGPATTMPPMPLYPSAYPPPPTTGTPSPIIPGSPYDNASARRASRMSMYGAAPTRSATTISRHGTSGSGSDEVPPSPSASTAVNKRRSFAAVDVHRRERSATWRTDRD